MRANPLLLLIAGPTASGKTALAVALSERLNQAPVVSADSRQCYRELNIGVARPSEEELARAKHYFIADRPVNQPLTAGAYEQEALALLEQLFTEHRVVILAGGSGLYIRALLEGLDTMPEIPEALRETLSYMEPQDQLALLLRKDPEAASLIKTDNPRRVQRALELVLSTGQTLNKLRSGAKAERPFEVIAFGTDPGREHLYQLIEQRSARMIEAGLAKEAASVRHLAHFQALQTVGYPEMFAFLEGSISLEETRVRIAMNTRRYAKRQYTWFRNQMNLEWINPTDVNAATDLILRRIQEHHGL